MSRFLPRISTKDPTGRHAIIAPRAIHELTHCHSAALTEKSISALPSRMAAPGDVHPIVVPAAIAENVTVTK